MTTEELAGRNAEWLFHIFQNTLMWCFAYWYYAIPIFLFSCLIYGLMFGSTEKEN